MDYLKVLESSTQRADFDTNLEPKVSGIYAIVSKVDNKVYVGSAQHLLRRKQRHLKELRNKEHHSIYLQNAWNKHGKDNFEFIILELTNLENLVEREQSYLDSWPCDYNICKKAYSPLGVKRRPETLARMKESSPRGESHWTHKKIIPIETRLRQSAAHKERLCDKTLPWKGKKLPQERIDEMIKYRSKSISQYELNGTFIREWSSATEAAKALSIANTNITRVCKGKALTTAGYKWGYAVKDPYCDTKRCVDRLFSEYLEHPKLIIAVDFDSTVFDFYGEGHSFPRIIDILKECQKLDFYIVPFTASSPDRFDFMINFYAEKGIKVCTPNVNPIPLKYGHNGKMYFNLLLDDRAGLGQAYEILKQTVCKILQKTVKENRA